MDSPVVGSPPTERSGPVVVFHLVCIESNKLDGRLFLSPGVESELTPILYPPAIAAFLNVSADSLDD